MTETYSGDRIILRDLGFYGYHGLMSEENRLGQRFFIDLTCGVDLSAPGRTDLVGETISYAEIYEVVQRAFEKRCKLIEAVGENIADAVFTRFRAIEWIIVRVRKPEAPIAMVMGEAAIELHRHRSTR
ncbi:dihydroneopterin aldolase [Arsenicitalea aurantiaca]|uniref:7,8-dihydroneopterin aldolase n=1 Tax=Arsenicitalea aurantiaca TaxID=1783274 RepID=A0A433XG90_9HYPH|nr:dihydroneopterin aldolase [Arsenicitalea aurantiaca]RUT32968.1 dihydroneopterin aldolase [Arsenicitalea aurantiaca]